MPRPVLDESQFHPAIGAALALARAGGAEGAGGLLCSTRWWWWAWRRTRSRKRRARRWTPPACPTTTSSYGSYFSAVASAQALKMWTGWPTFPMVFVKGTLVGGAQDCSALIDSGELNGCWRMQARRSRARDVAPRGWRRLRAWWPLVVGRRARRCRAAGGPGPGPAADQRPALRACPACPNTRLAAAACRRALDPGTAAGPADRRALRRAAGAGAQRAPDPVFFFAGGPGQSAIDWRAPIGRMLRA